jgi:F-type H+-transporting ATPase subunit gamma
MANLRDIRDRIASVKSTQQITRAMKMVAAARLRKAQERMTDARPYTWKLREIVSRLLSKTQKPHSLFRKTGKPKRVLLLVMGSDRGLCGGFNNNLFRIVEHRIQDDFSEHRKEGTLSMICFGKKSYDYFRTRKYPVIDHKIGFFEHLEYQHVVEVMSRIVNDFENGTYDEVHLAYNEFKSVIAQQRRLQKILPIEIFDEVKPVPATGPEEIRKEAKSKEDLSDIDYLYEPDPDTILDVVLPLFVNIQIWQASLESFAAEQGARMTAMDSATENAGEIIRDLELKYNQARQAAITTEISEIVSGAEALSE